MDSYWRPLLVPAAVLAVANLVLVGWVWSCPLPGFSPTPYIASPRHASATVAEPGPAALAAVDAHGLRILDQLFERRLRAAAERAAVDPEALIPDDALRERAFSAARADDPEVHALLGAWAEALREAGAPLE
jgi:hypothetical protein